MLHTWREFAVDTVDVSALAVVIMSHGGKRDGKEYFIADDNGSILVDDIILNFTPNYAPRLRGVPKIFIFQACRGDGLDCEWEDDNVPQEGADVTRYPERADMLISYPSQAGYRSFRHGQNRRLLLNAVTNIVMRHAHRTHVLDMLTMVNEAVSDKLLPGGRPTDQESLLVI